jgi:hypothetical protein
MTPQRRKCTDKKKTAETSVVRQRLDDTRSRVLRCQREYTPVVGQRVWLP